MARKNATVYMCQECGYTSPKWMGQCPACQEWNTLVEERVHTKSEKNERSDFSDKKKLPQRLNKLEAKEEDRLKTSMQEFNRVLGGGVVPGSLVLIGGDPGIGKSTLLLQVAAELASLQQGVLYVSGEESETQIKMRAERLELPSDDFYVYPETDLDAIASAIDKLEIDFVVIDSIQTMNHPEIQSASGSVSQVRESTAELMKIAKKNNVTIFIVGHVTKQGNIAGPRMLEHMVDTVLYFEGDQNYTFRILRSVKNRFGSTNEIGVFEMRGEGLVEVLNPSELFLEERLEGTSGSSVVVSVEGTRPILAEIQALITPTVFGNAKRTASGLDHNRSSLIMAVLEKRADLMLQNQDAYLKASGGMKLDEPAIDLAIAVSIVSSYLEKQTSADECFVGELGLTGEIRRVSQIEKRVNEAAKLGFRKIYIPKNNLTEFLEVPDSIEIEGVTTIKECIQKIFN
ncbi:MAG: DNA repair protein RadA [Atopococcus tabaci]|uniref:DNA repair protein RadA n=1 Tax=Atopococcus tabaci TaxID=269774 RepID=A0AA43ZSN7_9LACT|nr:DNA repair protein RadA [Atopococcus tabaci]